MLRRDKTLAESLEIVTKARAIASPNLSFMEQLIEAETKVCGWYVRVSLCIGGKEWANSSWTIEGLRQKCA